MTVGLGIIEVIDSAKNTFHEAIKLEARVRVGSREKEKRGIEN